LLAGGSTGRDGIHGASFASKALEAENRSAIQIPDPFLEKLLLEATMEAVKQGCIKGIKDLGGGGLSCCLSETSDNLGKGFDVELTRVHARESDMTPNELMISESQERMLYVADKARLPALQSSLDNGKFVAIKLDGNSKHCYLDPYRGTLGCLSEGCRNVICTGAEPVGVVDHLQFASPEDPEIYWTFTQAINAIVDYCKFMDLP